VTKDGARRIAANIGKLAELVEVKGKAQRHIWSPERRQARGGAHYHRQGSDRVENIHHLNSVSAKLPVLLPKR
jgi:hypothetical protein